MASHSAHYDYAQPSHEHPVDLGVRLDIFLALQVIGLIGCIIVLFTALFSSVSRQVTWYNFFISWTIFCISYLLLFFAGQGHNHEPPFALCLAQSSLTYAAPPFAAAATLGMVIQLYCNIFTSLTGTRIKRERLWNIVIPLLPYLVFFGVTLESLIVGLVLKEARFSTVSYCSLETVVPGRVTAALVVFLIVPVLVLNVIIYRRLHNHSSALRTTRAFRSMFIRVTLFSLFGLISVVAGLLFFFVVFLQDSDDGLADLDIVLACIPNAAVLLFGTHKDLLQVWMFWKKDKKTRDFS
ncbi:hypothetical protein K435DRAFT_971613 [Dendrothele bispora CBS 962.96]|uniref:G-protein coupled receptors family 1 profile domain-containing protein n=1 Tax=Dendrothele bispora (strain CBS 962.96) TaxID=1314807 RepID=A0A4S8L459_DENBC|nr:hypothetical protein K435DRAFT_971613 [Dendrothele bispora CBS 962.96]